MLLTLALGAENKQDGKPIKWTCDKEMALGYMNIVA